MEDVRTWFMVRYDGGSFGLKKGDGVNRGVPEGPRDLWTSIIEAIRTGGSWHSTRLAYSPEEGITSPRNTNYDHDAFHTIDADLIVYLLDHPQEWREDHLTDARPAEDYLRSPPVSG